MLTIRPSRAAKSEGRLLTKNSLCAMKLAKGVKLSKDGGHAVFCVGNIMFNGNDFSNINNRYTQTKRPPDGFHTKQYNSFVRPLISTRSWPIQTITSGGGACALVANSMSHIYYNKFNEDLTKFTQYMSKDNLDEKKLVKFAEKK